MATTLAQKAPADVVEYTITIDGLNGDTIAAVSVSASGITLTPPGSPVPASTATTVVFWVSAGTLGVDGQITMTITTVGGRTLQRLLTIPIRAL